MLTVAAKRVESLFAPGAAAGAYKLRTDGGQIGGMSLRCPCGCGRIFSIDFTPPHSSGWEWSGDMDAPTVRPAVTTMVAGGEGGSQEHWRGLLTEGVWREVADE